MKLMAFASRNWKEMVRDKLNLMFGIGFPVVLLLLLTVIQSNIPVPLFTLDQLTPGVAVFGLSFIALFSGILIAKDRTSSFMLRLFASPLRAVEFLLGYILPLLPMAAAQILLCFLAAGVLGLPLTGNVLWSVAVLLPASVLFIALGLLCGCLLTDKQVGGVCGALLTNLTAWLSGTWFDLNLVGGIFLDIANALPFVHAVEAGRAALTGDLAGVFPHLWWVLGYGILFLGLAVWVFTHRTNGDQK
jgi:ABC-2 type transport system permease protein